MVQKEKLEKIVNESISFKEVAKKLNMNFRNIQFFNIKLDIKKFKISTEHFIRKQTENRWKKEKLVKLVNECDTLGEIINKMGLYACTSSYNRLHNKLIEYDIDYSRILNKNIKDRWKEKNLKPIVENSDSVKEVLKKLKLRNAGGNFKTLEKYVEKYDLSIEHFVKIEHVFRNKIPTEKILVENSTYHRGHLKDRLYKEGLKERKCELCGQGEEWNDMKISLILDHINGIHNDNRIENLRIVCPNCNAGLDTHCKGNRKSKKIKYYCECGNEKLKNSKRCSDCSYKLRRRVERPSYEQLMKEIKESNYVKVGKKYGVTDNAIRKWLKQYKK